MTGPAPRIAPIQAKDVVLETCALIQAAQAGEELVSQHIAYLDHIGLQHTNQTQGIFSGICYASYPHSMVFRADGKIEKCTVALDHPKNLLGWVDPGAGRCTGRRNQTGYGAFPI